MQTLVTTALQKCSSHALQLKLSRSYINAGLIHRYEQSH